MFALCIIIPLYQAQETLRLTKRFLLESTLLRPLNREITGILILNQVPTSFPTELFDIKFPDRFSLKFFGQCLRLCRACVIRVLCALWK